MRLPPELQWQTQAACQGCEPEIFFSDGHINRALEYCNNCPVQTDCLHYAKKERIHWGIWGGQTPDQRKGKTGQLGRPRKDIPHGTYAGFRAHEYRGEKPCTECRHAYNKYMTENARERRNKKADTTCPAP